MAENHPLIVDLSRPTGPVRHGACGFLYGLGKEEIPSANLLAPLRPQVAAQKPEDGLQHPNGDALNVSGTYQAAGGREIEIYIQDVFAQWPYEFAGLEDYLGRVEQVVRRVEAHARRALFSYVPFNEPDQIWYNKTDRKQAFFEDWRTVYQKIRSLAPGARIVGPNFANYDSATYREFMIFASQNSCLPDVISWHELNDAFFGGWYGRYEDFRAIERSLGLAPREICINEYCRIQGDLGVPGQLIQWVTRFENSKVDACLAYWTDAGSLNNLAARDHSNRASGAWWLYRWYGGLSGHTVQVTPPDANAEGLQGLAAFDAEKQQARILLGGCSGAVELKVTGCQAAAGWGPKIRAAVWEAQYTGFNPSPDPALVLDAELDVTGGQATLLLEHLAAQSAYQVILSPARAALPAKEALYPALYADLAGEARPAYGEASCVEVGAGGSASFVVTAPRGGFYKIGLRYAAGTGGSLRLALNGSPLAEAALAPAPGWAGWELTAFLMDGINRIACEALTGAIQLAWLELAPTEGEIRAYEAEAPGNLLGGSAAVIEDPAASGGRCVGQIGSGAANFLEFSAVEAPRDGLYRMVVHFANGDFRGGHSYNSQVVDRCADIQVNGQGAQRVYFRNTFDWHTYQTRAVDVVLQAGSNRVRFSNPDGDAPHIDQIEIAAPTV